MIQSEVKALEQMGREYLILTGECYTGEYGLRQVVIPSLRYKEETDEVEKEAQELYENCLSAVEECFSSREVVWHFHNHSVGKNVLYAGLIGRLAEAGQRMLLQCHDFAEDGRPRNYLLFNTDDTLYPLAPHVHYATINSRDHEILVKAGVASEQVHYLPNAISPPLIEKAPPAPPVRVIYYPVRGIRRKNLGEFILWAALAPEDCTFALSLAPESEQWLPYYKVWEAAVEELELPVYLDCVDRFAPEGKEGGSFTDWLSVSTHCITTSVAEGFGLTFLEPTFYQTPLIGRDLPEITSDFKKGKEWPGLYEKLLVPLSDLNEDELKAELRLGVESFYLSYRKPFEEQYAEQAWEEMTQGGMVDFGNLPEHRQLSLIHRACNEGYRGFSVQLSTGELRPATDWILSALKEPPVREDVTADFSMERYKKRLEEALLKISAEDSHTPTWLKKENILQAFLTPENFHFLRT